MRPFFRFLVLATVGLAIVFLIAASASPPPVRYEIAPESRFWIDGTATTGRWTCEAADVSGHGASGDGALSVEIAIPVRDLDCGSGVMNRDLARALGADDHPDIAFTLDHAEPVGTEPAPGTWVPVEATGTLRLAGADRQITVQAEGRRQPDGRVEVRGRHALLMTDFGVRPPSHVAGLVRARDAVVARFELVAVAH